MTEVIITSAGSYFEVSYDAADKISCYYLDPRYIKLTMKFVGEVWNRHITLSIIKNFSVTEFSHRVHSEFEGSNSIDQRLQ